VENVKNTSLVISTKNVLTIRANISFKKILKKIYKNKKADIVILEKAKSNQMAAILLSRLMGKKFIWAQCFSNPPTPNFPAKLLMNQADTIIVASKKSAAKLHSFGIDKPKIRIRK